MNSKDQLTCTVNFKALMMEFSLMKTSMTSLSLFHLLMILMLNLIILSNVGFMGNKVIDQFQADHQEESLILEERHPKPLVINK